MKKIKNKKINEKIKIILKPFKVYNFLLLFFLFYFFDLLLTYFYDLFDLLLTYYVFKHFTLKNKVVIYNHNSF